MLQEYKSSMRSNIKVCEIYYAKTLSPSPTTAAKQVFHILHALHIYMDMHNIQINF